MERERESCIPQETNELPFFASQSEVTKAFIKYGMYFLLHECLSRNKSIKRLFSSRP